jgi:hypothetical protein
MALRFENCGLITKFHRDEWRDGLSSIGKFHGQVLLTTRPETV